MADTCSKTQEAVEYIRHKKPSVPGVGSISGLGKFAMRRFAQTASSFLVESV